MNFVDFVGVIRRHKLGFFIGLSTVAAMVILAGYRIQGTKLVPRGQSFYETTSVVALQAGPKEGVEFDPPSNQTLFGVALSIHSAVQAPGFTQKAQAIAPNWDGKISAVVPDDTNVVRLTTSGSTPARAIAGMEATLGQMAQTAQTYSATQALPYSLGTNVLDGPSEPTKVRSFKSPITSAISGLIGLVLLWMLISARDQLQQARLRREALLAEPPEPRAFLGPEEETRRKAEAPADRRRMRAPEEEPKRQTEEAPSATSSVRVRAFPNNIPERELQTNAGSRKSAEPASRITRIPNSRPQPEEDEVNRRSLWIPEKGNPRETATE